MHAKTLFSVAIRVFGLYYAGRGFNDLLYFAVMYLGIKPVSVNVGLPYTELYYGLFFFFFGLYLLRGAPSLVTFAFPIRKNAAKESAEETVEEN